MESPNNDYNRITRATMLCETLVATIIRNKLYASGEELTRLDSEMKAAADIRQRFLSGESQLCDFILKNFPNEITKFKH